jgi:hypothetical protein
MSDRDTKVGAHASRRGNRPQILHGVELYYQENFSFRLKKPLSTKLLNFATLAGRL